MPWRPTFSIIYIFSVENLGLLFSSRYLLVFTFPESILVNSYLKVLDQTKTRLMRLLLMFILAVFLSGCDGTQYTTQITSTEGEEMKLRFTKTPDEVLISTDIKNIVREDPELITLQNLQSDSITVYVANR
jgi:hypothetical protein